MMKNRYFILCSMAGILILFTGCTPIDGKTPTSAPLVEPPAVSLVLNPDISDVSAGQTVALSVEASGRGLTFKWSATRGTLSAIDVPTVIYTAPNTAGLDTVTVEVNSVTGTTIKSVSFNVIVPPTDTPTPTPVVTNTPLPEPEAEIFPQINGGKGFIFENNGGSVDDIILPNQHCVHSGVYGLKLVYSMTGSGNGGWGVQWRGPDGKPFDASSYNIFTFWVKGNSGGEIFQIGLKDSSGKEVKIESKDIVVVSTDWLQVVIRLDRFKGVRTASLENFNLGFNKNHGSGSICIDDFAFLAVP